MTSSYASFLTGHLTRLRPLEPTDIPFIYRWLNDPEVTHYMFYGQKPLSVAQVSHMIQAQVDSDSNVVLMIESRKERKPIGFCGLYDIHLTARKAEYRILIGEKTFWNKGCGTEVTDILTYYAFDRLNLNRVWLGVTHENQGAVKAYEKSGYKTEGVLRQEIYRNSRYYDAVRMGILREEYYPALAERHRRRLVHENIPKRRRA